MRIKTLLTVAVAAAFVALWALSSPAAEAPKNMEVLAVGGVVEVGAKSDVAWNPLSVGYPLLPGKGVRCGVTGGAVMRWFSGNVVKMRHLTSLTVNELTSNAAGLEKTEIELLYGQIFVHAKPLPTPESALRLKTPASAAEVRGSAEYSVMTDGNGRTTFNVMEGQITVEAQGIAVLIDNGYQITVDTGKPPGEIITMPVDVKTELLAETKKVRNALKVPGPPPPQMADAGSQHAIQLTQAPAAASATSTAATVGTAPAAPASTSLAAATPAPARETAPPGSAAPQNGTAVAAAKTDEEKKPPAGKAEQPAKPAPTTIPAAEAKKPEAKTTTEAAPPSELVAELKPQEIKPVQKAAQMDSPSSVQPVATATVTTAATAPAMAADIPATERAKTETAKPAEIAARPAANDKKAESATSTIATPDASAKAKKPEENKAEAQKPADVKPAPAAEKGQPQKKTEDKKPAPAAEKKTAPAPEEKKAKQPPPVETVKPEKPEETAPGGELHQEIIDDMLEFILSE